MTPKAEPSQYHDNPPLGHDLNYEMEEGVPIIHQVVTHAE